MQVAHGEHFGKLSADGATRQERGLKMATRYRLFVVDMADRDVKDFKHELGELYGVRILSLDPITTETETPKSEIKRAIPKTRLGSGDSLGEVPHVTSGVAMTSAPRTDLMLCRSCSDGKCAECFYPLDCPCVAPMHNSAPWKSLEIEAMRIG